MSKNLSIASSCGECQPPLNGGIKDVQNQEIHMSTLSKRHIDGTFEITSMASSPPSVVAQRIAKKARTQKRKTKCPDMPKRALSAYNIFFQQERALIIGVGVDGKTSQSGNEESSEQGNVIFQQDHDDNNLLLNKNFNGIFIPGLTTNRGKKRAHRKTHGKIGFAELAKKIAQKWHSLDAKSKAFFEAQAVLDKERYKKELQVYQERKVLKEKRVAMSDWCKQELQRYQEQPSPGGTDRRDWTEWCKEELKIYQKQRNTSDESSNSPKTTNIPSIYKGEGGSKVQFLPTLPSLPRFSTDTFSDGSKPFEFNERNQETTPPSDGGIMNASCAEKLIDILSAATDPTYCHLEQNRSSSSANCGESIQTDAELDKIVELLDV